MWGSVREHAYAACTEPGSGRAESPLVTSLPKPAREGRDIILSMPKFRL